MALFSDTYSAGPGLFSAFDRARLAVRAARARRAAFLRTYNELDNLTDRELSDLGLSRADIGRVARSAAE